ncbi:MAG TPA: D-alanyl-D-alanine carboxypeptidase family protein [Sphingomicrobium sp.]
MAAPSRPAEGPSVFQRIGDYFQKEQNARLVREQAEEEALAAGKAAMRREDVTNAIRESDRDDRARRPVRAATPPVMPGTPYEKNGYMVVDTPRKDPAGHVPTHRLEQPSGKRDDESWTDYEDRVIAQRSFSPDTTKVSSLRALNRPVADSARSMLAAARGAGVNLGVVETKRSQERQEMLFQKGRKPGTGGVVTWTLTSDHTPGRAIDFTGSPSALRWLQKNATKFGFTVMGDLDPGHVSMP